MSPPETIDTHEDSRSEESFGFAAERAIRSAQAAFSELIADAGLDGSRAVDLARTLSLDKTLAWKLARFADEGDPCAAFRHLPGPGGVEIVVRAAEGIGVDPSHLEEVRRADRDLRGFVRQHAGDRRTFEAMLAGARPDPKAEAEERKAYFKAGSAIWGVRAKAQLLTLALRPSRTSPDHLDCVQVSGFVDLERLRPDVPWVIRRLRVHGDDGTPVEPFVREPLDPDGAALGEPGDRPLSLMSNFCTHPFPQIRQRVGETGWLYDELAPGALGRRGATTVIAGEVYRSALPRYKSEGNAEGRYLLTIRTPVERVQFDLLLHPDLGHFRWPTALVIGNLEERISSERAPGRELFPVRPAEALPAGVVRSATEIPMYQPMVSEAFERAGWGDPSLFRGYRVALEYPPAPCEIQLRCELSDSD